jgi:hypothetical protein
MRKQAALREHVETARINKKEALAMAEAAKKCMLCARPVAILKGRICSDWQEKIRREAMGEQAHTNAAAEHELSRDGVPPTKK